MKTSKCHVFVRAVEDLNWLLLTLQAASLAKKELNRSLDLIRNALMDMSANLHSRLSAMRADFADLKTIHAKYPELGRQLQRLIFIETNAGDNAGEKPPVEQENDREEDLSETADWLTADQFKRLSASLGAVFTFLYKQLKSLKHVYRHSRPGIMDALPFWIWRGASWEGVGGPVNVKHFTDSKLFKRRFLRSLRKTETGTC